VISLDPIADQLLVVQRRYPFAHLKPLANGMRLVVVPEVAVAPGFSLQHVSITIAIPAGYPQVGLDCFYTELALTLVGGSPPQNSQMQVLGEEQVRWFSWHPAAWDPQRDDLEHYVRFCESRLRKAV
jgi:hypothetical protein